MGFGDSLKKWAQSKATEMLTADGQKRSERRASADAAESAGQERPRRDAAAHGVPQARRDGRQAGGEQDRPRAGRGAGAPRRDRLAPARDRGALGERATSTGQWSGQLHWAWNDISPNDPDPTDPYADKPLVWFELFSEDAEQPDLGGLLLTHWSFQIPGYTGDGTYDLTAIAREREAAGAALEYLEWAMDFANADDASFYFYSERGRSRR